MIQGLLEMLKKPYTCPISKKQTIQAQQQALKAHQVLLCRHYSRIDMIMDKQGKLWVLEVNTLPGMTSASLLPKSAQAAGIKFSKLLDKIIELSYA